MAKRKYRQGTYTPKNPDKWINCRENQQIIYRSSWERKFMMFLDENPAVLECGSENLIIKYINPLKKKWARYFPDFYVKIQDKQGKITEYIIEVKPSKETQAPQRKQGKRRKTLIYERATYMVNISKWAYAKKYCESKGYIFKLIGEKELGI
jgi:hypothetical protein